jgi:hypothetical protein
MDCFVASLLAMTTDLALFQRFNSDS